MSTDPSAARYLRNAAAVTRQPVSPPRAAGGHRLWQRLGTRPPAPAPVDGAVRAEAEEVLAAFDRAAGALRDALPRLAALRRPRLFGKVEDDQNRVERTAVGVGRAREALAGGDVGECGRLVLEAHRELSALGSQLAVALQQELAQAAIPRDLRAALEGSARRRWEAQQAVETARQRSERDVVIASTAVAVAVAEGLSLSAQILAHQGAPPPPVAPVTRREDGMAVIPPQELETFADVGGLEATKAQLRRSASLILERAAAGRPSIAHNGILLYGPPGTGKTLLARALAGEYGLRFLRFSPALIASAYQHEPAKKLRQVFTLAAESAPCLLFLDEVDTIGGRREGATADQRELVTQLLNSLEEYRDVRGLLIVAATNTVDHLDPALREGRFDSRIAVPLPDASTRAEILGTVLRRLGTDVAWEGMDLQDLAQRTAGRSGAALRTIVTGAVERAMAEGAPLGHGHLVAEIAGRSGQDRAQTLEREVTWADVVLPQDVQQRLQEILLVFQQPELGRSLGVEPPRGILLYGPPGTGKTTIARALATEVKASFYEQSAADLLSKWVGESEQKVAQLFTRARANRPSIIFCDEIDALLKRRSADSSSPWEERVVSQFLRELDGLHSGEGVLLVGATNRVDIIDEAVRERRLVPMEVPLPDEEGRRRLLAVLCREVRLAPDVDLGELARHTGGMSGADLKSLRNSAGLKALTRAARGGSPGAAAVTRADFAAALAERQQPSAAGGGAAGASR